MKIVNLAKRPFENRRPVRRLAIILWVLGGIFTLANLWLFWDHLTGFSATTDQLADVRAETERETREIERLGQEVAALALDEQNEEVAILNQLIADRTFPWGLLFDRLESVLPDQVWLKSVRPQRENEFDGKPATRPTSGRRGSRRRRAKETPSGVRLTLPGQARNTAALFTLVDRLFADPTFEQPSLHNQSTNRSGLIDFNLDVTFMVEIAQRSAEGEAIEAPSELVIADAPHARADTTVAPEREAHDVAAPADDPDALAAVSDVGEAPTLLPLGGEAVIDRASAMKTDDSPTTASRRSPKRRDQTSPPVSRGGVAREPGATRPADRSRVAEDDEDDQDDQDDRSATRRAPNLIPAGSVPIIIAPSPRPNAQAPVAAGPGALAPPTPGTRPPAPSPEAEGSSPVGPATAPAPPTRPPGGAPPSPTASPDPGRDTAPPPPPPQLTEDDLEPLPPTAPASSSARIGGRG